jgi:hypothetical protein
MIFLHPQKYEKHISQAFEIPAKIDIKNRFSKTLNLLDNFPNEDAEE